MTQTADIEHAQRIKQKYENQLLQLTNVVGVGVGLKYSAGQPTGQVAVVVNVNTKKSVTELSQPDVIPAELEGVPVDVQEVGTFKAL